MCAFNQILGSRNPAESGYLAVTILFGLLTQASGVVELTTLHSFSGIDGALPEAALVQGADGFLYGTTIGGGTNDAEFGGRGTIFRLSTDGDFKTLVHLADSSGSNPQSGLTQTGDGSLYGVTDYGGDFGAGAFYRFSPDGTYTHLASFDGANAGYPHGLTEGADGHLYGTAIYGGTDGVGTVFRATRNGEISMLASFNGDNGAHPQTSLARDQGGTFYGTTTSGGTNGGFGTIFRIAPDGALTSLFSFNGTNGAHPVAPPIQATDGDLYGTTLGGGLGFAGDLTSGYGTVYRISPEGHFATVVWFNQTNGANPAFTGLIQGSDGHLYGTTERGGSHGLGTVYRLTTKGYLTTLISFTGSNGAEPIAGLIQEPDGSFYGVTMTGGQHGLGTVFRMQLRNPVQLVQRLVSTVSTSDLHHKRPLLASLEAALASIERSSHYSATGQLGAFQNKVVAQVLKRDPVLAVELIEGAQQVIDALQDSP